MALYSLNGSSSSLSLFAFETKQEDQEHKHHDHPTNDEHRHEEVEPSWIFAAPNSYITIKISQTRKCYTDSDLLTNDRGERDPSYSYH